MISFVSCPNSDCPAGFPKDVFDKMIGEWSGLARNVFTCYPTLVTSVFFPMVRSDSSWSRRKVSLKLGPASWLPLCLLRKKLMPTGNGPG